MHPESQGIPGEIRKVWLRDWPSGTNPQKKQPGILGLRLNHVNFEAYGTKAPQVLCGNLRLPCTELWREKMTLYLSNSRPRPGAAIAVNLSAFHRLLAGFLLMAALGLACSVPASADVYRWVDDDGTVNYGEREPRGRDFTVISRSPETTKKPSATAPYLSLIHI